MLLIKLEVLFRKKGCWLYMTKREEKNWSQGTIYLVKAFYEDGEFSRQMPGKKDYVSVTHNTHKQKQLILSNLNELYANFKSKYVSTSIGFSKFCELQPKWCVLAGSSGTHSVCVCTYYQNMKLLLAPLNVTYQELFPLIVYDINTKEGMVYRCPKCPESNTLARFSVSYYWRFWWWWWWCNFLNVQLLIDQTLLTIQKLLMSMLTMW